ncbi:tRNA (adenosine(37)-N6)-threonylcarbamoyltransferase complex transferase subunit TsaD [Algisphaera agarilytica]|uniref:tRNA N6-adenosine threonylcarbamoyltransferase n=1 Tax=Algisphaera agarilytica TaxID=1385975 RepID=A0A7X0H9Q7_9BACT|nr:tRNA (adenosine(37)-N6)-threonylcarbamoyltransferase complex transferase subunit TsaD [Algisphaera agarilytica]MBB6431683.1 N6-L-threonylcarbamoyladenine synthase [Algisphaera agarilytica]
MTLILGLETSCDETAAAVVRDGREVLSNVVATQHDLHVRYAGVVPEIASRAHLERLMPVVQQAIDDAGITLADLDAIAVGNRPGLVGSLIVGVAAAKALAWSLDKPLIGIDHVRAHLHAATLTPTKPRAAEQSDKAPDPSTSEIRNPKSEIVFPALGLVVSGGHTSLYRMDSAADITVLGRTIDDAIGEAYDKAGVILNAGYPGGPAMDKLSQQGDRNAEDVPELPISMLKPGSLDFSFSGLKTALLYAVRGLPVGRGKDATFERDASDLSPQRKADLAAAFQHAAVTAVERKIKRAIKQLAAEGVRPQSLVLGGGVSANSALRERVQTMAKNHGLSIHLPELGYCVDNAAMIAGYAHELLERGETSPLDLPVVATSRV